MLRLFFLLTLISISTTVIGEINMKVTPLKISVLSSNKVILNGKAVSPDELSEALVAAAKNNGIVWYYRENPAGEPPPASSQVIQMIIDNKLPISMSTKPDFSDYVDDNGHSKPR